MRKLAFRYRRLKEIYSNFKGNVGGELACVMDLVSESYPDSLTVGSPSWGASVSFRPVESHEEGAASAASG